MEVVENTNNSVVDVDLNKLTVEQLKQRLEELKVQEKAEKEKAEKEANEKLANLHTQMGYEDTKSFLRALHKVYRGNNSATRTKVTDSMKANIESSLKNGIKSSEIAEKVGVSVGTVQKVKRDLGLTNSRS